MLPSASSGAGSAGQNGSVCCGGGPSAHLPVNRVDVSYECLPWVAFPSGPLWPLSFLCLVRAQCQRASRDPSGFCTQSPARRALSVFTWMSLRACAPVCGRPPCPPRPRSSHLWSLCTEATAPRRKRARGATWWARDGATPAGSGTRRSRAESEDLAPAWMTMCLLPFKRGQRRMSGSRPCPLAVGIWNRCPLPWLTCWPPHPAWSVSRACGYVGMRFLSSPCTPRRGNKNGRLSHKNKKEGAGEGESNPCVSQRHKV